MMLSDRIVHRVRAVALATLLVGVSSLFAAAAGQSDSAEMSDEKLEAVARAYIQVFKIQQSYKPRIEAAKTTEEKSELQQSANQEMVGVIENEEDVTVTEYNDVIAAIGDDEELRERLQAHVDEIQKEESEKEKRR